MNYCAISKMNNMEVIELTKELIRCPSVTPKDFGCQDLLKGRLATLGFKVEDFRVNEVHNFWAVKGNQGPLFVFAGHTDVVPAGDLKAWRFDPFEPQIESGYLYGRGVADMKGSLAAMVIACEHYIHENPSFKGSIGFLVTGDEEGPALDGTRFMVDALKERGIQFDACLIGEPSSQTDLGDIVRHGRRGSLHGTLTFKGKQGHVAYPHLAQNPIHESLECLKKLTQYPWCSGTEEFPKTSFQIVDVKAGVGALNVIPGELLVKFNLRYSPAADPHTIDTQARTLLDLSGLDYTLKWHVSARPFLSEQGPFLNIIEHTLEHTQHKKPKFCTAGGTSDGRFIIDICNELVELGPCNRTIHQINERVKIDELNQLSLIYKKILEAYFYAPNCSK